MTRVSTDKSVRSIRRHLGGDAPGLLTRLRRDALQALAARPLYRHTLIGGVPDDLRVRIARRWPGDAKRGAAIAAVTALQRAVTALRARAAAVDAQAQSMRQAGHQRCIAPERLHWPRRWA